LEDSLEFWIDVMGFRDLRNWAIHRGDGRCAVQLAMVEGPGHMIELLEYTSPADRQTYKPRSSDVGSVHMGFYVENIDALLGWLPLNPASAKGFA
jgi:catechol 2,3-dioxygenase-like lactoylglutathione lyase family enzyme